MYTLRHPVMREVLSTRIWEVPRRAWAVGSYSTGPPAGGTPQILFDKTSSMTGRLRVYSLGCPVVKNVLYSLGRQLVGNVL